MYKTKGYQSRDSRAVPYARSDPDKVDKWQHDRHPAGAAAVRGGSLAQRLTGELQSAGASRRGGSNLLGRISGAGSQKGQELLSNGTAPAASSQLHGYGATLPPLTTAPNNGLELFPTTRTPGQGGRRALGRSAVGTALVAAGLGEQDEQERMRQREREAIRERERQRAMPQQQPQPQYNILGKGKVYVRVENLAQGTTADDVKSAFDPSPIINAKLSDTPSSNPNLVSIDLEYTDRAAAEELVKTYNGVVADGNALKVAIVPGPSLTKRIAEAAAAPVGGNGLGSRLGKSGQGRELVEPPAPSKMYSDSILRSDPTARVVTVADPTPVTTAQRQDAWARGSGSSLSSRVGGGRSSGSRMQAW